jgi:hypothetical protein
MHNFLKYHFVVRIITEGFKEIMQKLKAYDKI